MRVTVLDDDPGERIISGRESITVYLNGIEVKHAFSADDDKGEVIAAVLDSRGYLTAENGEVKHQTLFGQVWIERSPK
ncbi:TPA: hypothetical protein ACRR1E_003130 [Klebsiella quasipneumoniae]|uniref:hypothetical protein n=1 Tax=Klebsiella quasipneumoniae TaxID=1463165 RepID=UPI00190E866E|nr:hypothetical protein [Klebsiella quasipneumoniae]HDT0534397.1 hypothetical protein [Klebsiella quasipneumoniae subsp. similipneumoniae]